MKNLRWLSIFICWVHFQVALCDNHECQSRDSYYALQYGCAHACANDDGCPGDETCVCDYKCGLICVSETEDCSQPQNPENGYVTLPSAPIDNLGQEATFGCLEGVLYGNVTLRCLVTGEWSGPIPQCYLEDEEIPCLHPPPTMANAQSSVEGAKATYTCGDGATLEGESDVICNRDGSWSPLRGQCLMSTCEPPSTSPLPPGLVQYGLDYSIGSLVFYDCEEGYELQGVPVLQCQGDGNWDGVPPVCQGFYCPPIVTGDNVIVTASGEDDTLVDTTLVYTDVEFSCPEGYYLEGPGSCTCLGDLTWACGVVPTCEEITCFAKSQEEYRSTGTNYHEFPKVVFSYQEQITLFCLIDDATLFGDSSQTCVGRNQWSGETGECKRTCPELLHDLANGERELILGYPEHGGCVIFICDKGYRMTGNSRFFCDDGAWTEGTLPTCVLDQDGFHDYQVKVAHKFSYASEVVTAQEWEEGLEIACKVPRFRRPEWFFNLGKLPRKTHSSHLRGDWYTLKFPPLRRDMAGVYSCVVHGNSGKYVSVILDIKSTCADLGPLENGETPDYGTRQAGVFTSYACNAGYHIAGKSTIACQEDGTWSGPKPTCVKDNCEMFLPSILHSVILERTYDSPEKLHGFLKVSCNIGFFRVGAGTMECQNSKWIGQAPICAIAAHEVEIRDEVTGGYLTHATFVVKEDGVLHLSCARLDVLEVTTRFRKYEGGSAVQDFGGELVINSFQSSDIGEYACETSSGMRLQTLNLEMLRRCVAITQLANGFIVPETDSSQPYLDGTFIRFACNEGFELRGNHSCYCSDGEWVSEIPECVPETELAIDSDANVSNDGQINLLAGAELFLTCFVESSTPIETLMRDYMLDWSFSGDIIANGTFYQMRTFDDGLRLRLPVATVDHSGTYTCGTTYTEESFSLNILEPCSDIVSIEHGSVVLIRDGHLTAEFTCDDRYELQGPSELECLMNGEWDDNPPICQVYSCLPIEVANGDVTNTDFRIGQEVSIECDSGWETTDFSGPLICLPDGTWDRRVPTCTEKCTNKVCPFGKTCEVIDGLAVCVCVMSSECEDLSDLTEDDRVCATNGQTYPSHCHLEVDACEDPGLAVLYAGTCVIAGRCRLQPFDKFRAKEQNISIDYNKFYYDGEKCQITPLSYGVPMGAGFTEKEDCERTCIRENFCFLAQDAGDCSGETTIRWSYNDRLSLCQTFLYSGCGGNENNFMTKDQCLKTCPDRCPVCERRVSLSRLCCLETTFMLAKITRRNRFQTGTVFNLDILQVVSPPDQDLLSIDPDTRLLQSHRDDGEDCQCPNVMTLETPFIIVVDDNFPTLTEDTFAEPWTQELQSQFLATASCASYVSTLFTVLEEPTCADS